MIGETIKAFTAALPGWRAVYYDKESEGFHEIALAGWKVATDNHEGYDYTIPQIWAEISLDDPTSSSNFCDILAPDEVTPAVDSQRGIEWVAQVLAAESE